jgi:hypothetical protein
MIVRVNEGAAPEIVHSAATMKDARYWLQYIALPGDAMFKTPAHASCNGAGSCVYQAHLRARGKIEHDEKLWVSTTLKGTPISIAEPA